MGKVKAFRHVLGLKVRNFGVERGKTDSIDELLGGSSIWYLALAIVRHAIIEVEEKEALFRNNLKYLES